MTRVHVGCGIRNPFGARVLWPVWAVCAVTAALLMIMLDSPWPLLCYLPWLAGVGLAIRWEIIHAPGKMYRTWWP